jgi:hypothetical protein
MGALRMKGDIRKLRKRTERVRSGRSANGAISTDFPGNGSAALARTNTDRTLGASTRQGWRLAVTKAERDAHKSRPTQNSAGYIAIDSPMTRAAMVTNCRVKRTDSL